MNILMKEVIQLSLSKDFIQKMTLYARGKGVSIGTYVEDLVTSDIDIALGSKDAIGKAFLKLSDAMDAGDRATMIQLLKLPPESLKREVKQEDDNSDGGVNHPLPEIKEKQPRFDMAAKKMGFNQSNEVSDQISKREMTKLATKDVSRDIVESTRKKMKDSDIMGMDSDDAYEEAPIEVEEVVIPTEDFDFNEDETPDLDAIGEPDPYIVRAGQEESTEEMVTPQELQANTDNVRPSESDPKTKAYNIKAQAGYLSMKRLKEPMPVAKARKLKYDPNDPNFMQQFGIGTGQYLNETRRVKPLPKGSDAANERDMRSVLSKL